MRIHAKIFILLMVAGTQASGVDRAAGNGAGNLTASVDYKPDIKDGPDAGSPVPKDKFDVHVTMKRADAVNVQGSSEDSSDAQGGPAAVHQVHVYAIGKGMNDAPLPENAQEIILDPSRPLILKVKSPMVTSTGVPCDENLGQILKAAALKFKGLAAKAKSSSSSLNPRPPPTIPQQIVPLGRPFPLSAGDERILEEIESTPEMEGMSDEERNRQLGKFIELVERLRAVGLNQQIKLPRLVLIGDTHDNPKYGLIEQLLGAPGALSSPGGVMEVNPRFPAPLRFTLKSSAPGTLVEFRIDGGEWRGMTSTPGQLFLALREVPALEAALSKNQLLSKPVHVEVRGPDLNPLLFIDLPLREPDALKPEDQAQNHTVMADLWNKYLGQPWNVLIAVGAGVKPFTSWESLRLLRTFDPQMQRSFVVAVDPPVNEDEKIYGLIAGLRESNKRLSQQRIFYINSRTTASAGSGPILVPDASAPPANASILPASAPAPMAYCKVAGCGTESLIRSLQLRILRTWSAMRLDAQRLLQGIQEGWFGKLGSYEEFLKLADEEKRKALAGQVQAALIDSVVFLLEDRRGNGAGASCTGSPLDRITSSLFKDGAAADANDNTASNSSSSSSGTSMASTWVNLFANYQREVAALPTFPAVIDWPAIHVALQDLRQAGPGPASTREIKRILLSQLDALQVPKERLLDAAKLTWKETLGRALNSKASLEAFPIYRSMVLKEAAQYLQQAALKVDVLNKELVNADAYSGWMDHYLEGEAGNNTLWSQLLHASSDQAAFESLTTIATNRFQEIRTRHAVLLPRFIILNLLTDTVVQSVLLQLQQQLKEPELMKLSPEAEKKIEGLRQQVKMFGDLLENFDITLVKDEAQKKQA